MRTCGDPRPKARHLAKDMEQSRDLDHEALRMKLTITLEFTPAAQAAARDIALDLTPHTGAIAPVIGDLIQFPGQPIIFVVIGRIWQPRDPDNVELRIMLDLSPAPLSVV